MSRLTIKAESLPQRCEICHKSDSFDPVLNHCARCYGVTFDPKAIDVGPVIVLDRRMFLEILFGTAKLGTAAGAVIAGAATFFLIAAPSPPEAFYVLAVASGIGGPLMGIFCGLCLNALIMIAKWVESVHDRLF